MYVWTRFNDIINCWKEHFKSSMDKKTIFCKHDEGCLIAAFKQAIKQLKYGFIISAILQLIKSLRSMTKGMQNLKKSFTPEYFSIIVFLSSSTLALRLVKCALRWIRNKDDGINSFLGGVAAGYMGTITLNKNYWYILLMFISSRIVGAIHQYLIEAGYLNPEHRHFHYYMFFAFSNIFHAYGYFIQPDILKPDVYNLYQKMAVLTPNQKRWHLASLIFKKKELQTRGIRKFSDFSDQKINKLRKQVAKTLKL